MRNTPTELALLCLAVGSLLGCNNPPVSLGDDWAGPRGRWVEVWRDDFEGPSNSAPDASRWNVEVRPQGQNQEQDYDTDRRENSFLDGSGNLVIKAYRENFVDGSGRPSSQPYTSARLNTKGHFEQTYGRFEAKIRLPSGKGLWPAFWLLGSNIGDVGWPNCGEIDILEMAGSEPYRVDASLHGPGYAGTGALTRSFDLPNEEPFANAFHTFTFEWTSDGMRWLLDGEVFHVRTPGGLAEVERDWVFDHPFYLIINLAVGGLYDGSPDSSTVFPAEMAIDYISVSQLEPD